MSSSANAATKIARDYYNSSDADRFYAEVWGGEDIHVGLYESKDEQIKVASRRTVDHLADRLTGVDENSTVLDIGSGYGGAARRLVERFGCKVICVNLSDAENERNRVLSKDSGMSDKIEVHDASFEDIPLDDGSVDAVWSQDAILHSGNRSQVLAEVNRVLKPGGQFVFTDPMQADDCPAGVLDAILARIHLPDLGCPRFYKTVASDLGWKDLGFENRTEQLVNHYTRVLETTESLESQLSGKISDEYIARMKAGLKHWIDGGHKGYLSWGVFLFQK